MEVEQSQFEESKMRKALFKGIEEVVDKQARLYEFERHDWEIKNPSQRMMYVPKESVANFMKVVEQESEKRINKYRDYAQTMKVKFDEYEAQSERYYSDMLDKFKLQAREVVQKKQAALDVLNAETVAKQDRILRIRERMTLKSYHGLDSESEGEKEEEKKVLVADVNEYNKIKTEQQTKKAVIEQWIVQFRKSNNGNAPTEADIGPIQTQVQEYDVANKAYVEYRNRMIEQNKLPFEIEVFNTQVLQVNAESDQKNRTGMSSGPQRQAQMMQTLGAGFRKQVLITQHAMQLQAEIDEIRAQMIAQDGSGNFVSYVDQLKQKDNLLMERSQKLEDIARQNQLQKQEKDKLQQKINDVGTQKLISQAKGGVATGYADEASEKIANIKAQNNELLQQIEALNKVNATMLARVKALGGKGLSDEQMKEIEQDVVDSQSRMIEGHKDQQEAQLRAQQALEDELQKASAPEPSAQEGEDEKPSTAEEKDAKAEEARANKLKELEGIVVQFKQQNQDKQVKIQELEKENASMSTDFDTELKKVQTEFDQVNKEAKEEQKQMQDKLTKLEAEIAKSGGAIPKAAPVVDEAAHKKEAEKLKKDFDKQLKDKQKKIEELESRISQATALTGTQAAELAEIREKLAESLKQNKSLQIKIEKFAEAAGQTKALKEKASLLKQHLKEATAELDIVSTKYKEEQKKRKGLLNELEDLKGKVRVYCRIRPFSDREKTDADKAQHCVNIIDEVSLTVGTQKNRMKSYNFDSVFGLNSTQEEVFDDTKRLIQSAIDGFNVCIFAYGQTGSGKTFTIQGSPDKPGLTPRAIVEMFEVLKGMTNFDIKLKCYMVELYLNGLRDLLRDKEHAPVDLDIKESPSGMVIIQGVTEIELTSISQTEQIFEDGLSGRKTRKTQMNDASSRSHLIFSIIVDSTNVNTGVRTIGKLSFVDLAGSEKSSKTGTDAEGQEEANAINLSLSALGNVISALSDGSKFIPYRNHILTKLMKDSLGGTAKTLMFVNCSPSVYNESETKNSLDYATRVKKIKNIVGKNVESSKEANKFKEALNQMDSMMEKMKNLLRGSDRKEEWNALEADFNKPMHEFAGDVQ